MWADEAKITVMSGDGGSGCMSFRREKYVPRGGPDGGDGGRGGDVVLESHEDVQTLADFLYKPLYEGKRGGHGKGKNQHGADMDPVFIRVPVGTRVLEDSKLLVDLDQPGMRFVAARGGRGGRGNASFATSRFQAPRVAEKGQPGEKRVLSLELSLLADVGIVGLPNAGKSTLLSRVTQAKPKIADYPFTTLQPQLGAVRITDGRGFILADVPGLIEGASQGKGLGIRFLRHLERTRLLLHLVEVPEIGTYAELSRRIRTIVRELTKHHAKFARIPQILVFTKVDAFPDRERLESWRAKLAKKWGTIYFLSAVTGEGLDTLMEAAWRKIREPRPDEGLESSGAGPRTLYRAKRRFTVQKREGVFRVEGPEIKKWVAMTDFSNRDGGARFHRILSRMGVIKELKRLGVQSGDTVYCEEKEMTYYPDRGWR